MPIAHNLGFPHLGAARELKRATEGYWSGKVSLPDLLKTGAQLRARHWRLQQDAGIDLIPSNDFSYYDRMLDTSALVGAVPKRYGWAGGPAFLRAYRFLAERVPKAKILVATYFAGLGDNFPTALELPVAGLHLDAVRLSSASGNGASQLDALLQAWPAGGGSEGKVLSLGVIDGRNIWKADLSAVLRQLEDALERAGAAQLWVAPSCSLLHVPIDLDLETRLDSELKSWLAFARQKLLEV